jgi:hypothetical protein
MWRTSGGERVLKGAEWELFREGLRGLWDRVEESFDDDEPWPTGVEVFDRLTSPSKLVMLALVGKALCDEDQPSPPLSALTEGTFAAVYGVLSEEIDFEIEAAREGSEAREQPLLLRTRILAAIRETDPWCEQPTADTEQAADHEPAPVLPEVESDDAEEWVDLLDILKFRVLWDEDFDDEAAFVDAAPRFNTELKEHMGIDDGYFSVIAPDPKNAELVGIRNTLRALCVPTS